MVARGIALGLSRNDDIEVVGTAHTLIEGVALADEFDPDVVLLDAQSPDGDVLEAIRTLRSARPYTSVLVIGADITPARAARVLVAGASGAIDKKRDLRALAGALRACASGEKLVVDEQMLSEVLRLMRAPPRPGQTQLTPREREVLALLDAGLDAGHIATRLGIARNTARNYVQNVLTKLNAHSKLEAVAKARREGLITDE
jgi:DNA-binding NarL/FixJ family response regulator